MSAALEAREPSAQYLAELQPALVRQFELLATAPNGVARLRKLILTLAVQGKLTSQDCDEAPASALLDRLRDSKLRLISSGAIKQGKQRPGYDDPESTFDLPKGWIWARFGELCSYIQRGKGPAYTEQSEHKVVSQKCVRWYGLDLAPARFVTPESLAKYEPARFLRAGDLLWNSTGTGTIGRACVVPTEQDGAGLVADSHVTVVRPLEVNSRFLWRWIQSPFVQDEIEGSAAGTTNQIELNTSTVVNHPVPLPPLAEQARIVARVDELMRLCDALEAQGRLEAEQHARLLSTLLGTLTDSSTPEALAANWKRVADHLDLLLDRPEAVGALEQVILQLGLRGVLLPSPSLDGFPTAHGQQRSLQDDPFAWPIVKFGEVLTDLIYGTSAKCSYAKSGTPVLRIPNLRDGAIDISDLKFGDLEPKEVENLRLEVGDLLIIRSNGSAGLVGTAALVSSALPGFAFAGYLVRARLDRAKVAPHFMALVMRSPEVRRQIEGPIRTTSGVKNINSTEIQRISFTLPPLELQDLIVRTVTELRRLCAEMHERLDRCDAVQAALADAMIEKAGAA